jgi:hypothetical protein
LDGGKQLLDFPLQFGKFQIQHRLPGVHHHVQGTHELPQVLLHDRPHAPPDPVAFDSAAQHLAHGKAHAGTGSVIAFAVKRRDVSGKLLFAMLIDRLKIRVLQKS